MSNSPYEQARENEVSEKKYQINDLEKSVFPRADAALNRAFAVADAKINQASNSLSAKITKELFESTHFLSEAQFADENFLKNFATQLSPRSSAPQVSVTEHPRRPSFTNQRSAPQVLKAINNTQRFIFPHTKNNFADGSSYTVEAAYSAEDGTQKSTSVVVDATTGGVWVNFLDPRSIELGIVTIAAHSPGTIVECTGPLTTEQYEMVSTICKNYGLQLSSSQQPLQSNVSDPAADTRQEDCTSPTPQR